MGSTPASLTWFEKKGNMQIWMIFVLYFMTGVIVYNMCFYDIVQFWGYSYTESPALIEFLLFVVFWVPMLIMLYIKRKER